MKKFLILAFFLGLISPASAVPVSGTIEEGGPSGDYNGLTADHSFGDFSNGTGAPLLTATGDFKIWGSVKHQSSTNYKDGWTMDFGTGAYALVFDWQNASSSPLDFRLDIKKAGGTSNLGPSHNSLYTIQVADSGSVDFFSATGAVLSGLWTFSVDPIYGQYAPVETMNWQVTGTNMAAVPLPAALPLLAGGLGILGLAGWRRKRSDA